MPLQSYANQELVANAYADESEDNSNGEVTDEEITQEIKKLYAATPDLSFFRINVTTVNGIVSLQGVLRTKHQVWRAIEMAKGVKGVKSVDRSKIYAFER